MVLRSLLAPAFARRLARATRHRAPTPSTPTRTITTTPINFATRLRKVITPPSSIPTPTALSALLSRLSLPPNTTLHPVLVACLTHPSFTSQSSSFSLDHGLETETQTETDLTDLAQSTTETNEVLASLGNSLLGLFASEHLSTQFPYLPSAALKQAVTAYVGPKACMSVARELGLGTQNKVDGNFNGVGIRWRRTDGGELEMESTPVAQRFERYGAGQKGHRRHQKKDNFEDVVAGVVKAFVGLIYRERGIHAAREFTHAHFMSRYLDMTSLFEFTNPKHVLSSVISSHLAQAGVAPTEGVGKIESRVLASTGANSQAPLFNIGLFLKSGVKLAEGFGSSYTMAEHRAAVNALLSLFLVRADPSSSTTPLTLPTSVHAERLLQAGKLVGRASEVFTPNTSVESETVVESRRLRR